MSCPSVLSASNQPAQPPPLISFPHTPPLCFSVSRPSPVFWIQPPQCKVGISACRPLSRRAKFSGHRYYLGYFGQLRVSGLSPSFCNPTETIYNIHQRSPHSGALQLLRLGVGNSCILPVRTWCRFSPRKVRFCWDRGFSSVVGNKGLLDSLNSLVSALFLHLTTSTIFPINPQPHQYNITTSV